MLKLSGNDGRRGLVHDGAAGRQVLVEGCVVGAVAAGVLPGRRDPETGCRGNEESQQTEDAYERMR